MHLKMDFSVFKNNTMSGILSNGQQLSNILENKKIKNPHTLDDIEFEQQSKLTRNVVFVPSDMMNNKPNC